MKMIPAIIIILIVSTGIFIYLKHKAQNRSVDRSNRLAEKQEKLLEMLRDKNTNDEN